MKEHLLQIIQELSKRPYFDNCIIEMAINYDSIIGFNKKIFKESIDEYSDIISSTPNINSYNLTLTSERGDLDKYEDAWQRTSCIFYSCDDGDCSELTKCASFDWNTTGKSPRDTSLSMIGLQHTLHDKNEYKYENLSTLIDSMVELDKLFDKQQEEKRIIFNTFSNLI